ncbi:MAG: glycosidase, partial [Dictyoglomus turgidum]
PILQPEEIYEVEGWVPNVVFTCGVVPKNKDSTETLDLNDEILIYYGGADEVMALAEIKVGDLLPEDIIAKTY